MHAEIEAYNQSLDDCDQAIGKLGKRFKDASIFFNEPTEINTKVLRRWLKESKSVRWDYKNIVKRKGKLMRLE